eukprot:SAG11_NODE_6976_length_1216_cov_1.110116_1_plen_88_part_00
MASSTGSLITELPRLLPVIINAGTLNGIYEELYYFGEDGELLYFRRVQWYYVLQYQKCTKFKGTNKFVLEPALVDCLKGKKPEPTQA